MKSHKIYRFNAKWYNMPICTRKLLLLVMMNSLNPIVITAGDFVAMSFVTFNTVSITIYNLSKFIIILIKISFKVMRTSLSYFTIMRSMS